MKYSLSFSGGKDSTYLLLELIRRKYPLDEVVFFDTGWEFPAMYEHIEKCKNLCEENGIKFITLHPPKPFDYLMLEHITRNGDKGYSWCGGNSRWGTAYKTKALDKYRRQNKNNCIVYVGIAADETERLEKERGDRMRFPLADWGITESECLKGCYKAGFDWGGMYEHLSRLSCMYCRNKNLKELRNIKKYYPEVWCRLKEYQSKTNLPYKTNGTTVFDLDKRFAFEDERTAEGLSITSREFYSMLKKILKETSDHPTEEGGVQE
jgi:3'-phosphoadenosine 5'-phosphosulfate sulfotransferase (PAPS reductase)/FAD synthetase